jgi:hypothetical protein
MEKLMTWNEHISQIKQKAYEALLERGPHIEWSDVFFAIGDTEMHALPLNLPYHEAKGKIVSVPLNLPQHLK